MRTFGRYRLVELLASGGMADVWRAEVTGAAGVVREVALKLIRGEHEASSDFVRMFVEEARLASRLAHANIVQVQDFDQVDGRYYIAMELVRGHHLGRVVDRARERGVKLGLPRAVHVGTEIARGLAHAHRASEHGRPLGIVHRDVTPHNVLVSFEGEVKLADFGIARAAGRAGHTEPGTVKGKYAYMPPEQARGGDVDARADLFALGVVLWELCTGRRLFARENDLAVLEAVTSMEPVSPPSGWNEAVPPRLDALVGALLERDPARRVASADDAAASLAGVLLEVTRAHEEVDLRAFMGRLWPEGWRPASTLEPTRVRPPGATPAPGTPRTPAPEGSSRDGPPAPSPALAAEPAPEPWAAAPAEPAAERETRTSAATASRRRITVAAVTSAVALAAAAVLVVWRIAPGVPAPESAASPAPSLEAPAPAPAPAAERPVVAAPPDAPAGTQQASEGTVSPKVNTAPARTPAAARGSGQEQPVRGRPRGKAAVRRQADRHGGLEVPLAGTGDGLLFINVATWAQVFLDGDELGITPVEIQVPAGPYRVRLVHEDRVLEQTVRAVAGERVPFQPSLAR